MLALVLAGDAGEDLAPLTSEIPAAMIPVLDRPVMAHTIDLLRSHGVTDVVAVLRHAPDPVRRWFGDAVHYRVEYKPLGTAGAARTCRDLIADEPFLVVSGSVLTDLDVSALMGAHDSILTLSAGGSVLVAQPEVIGYFPPGQR